MRAQQGGACAMKVTVGGKEYEIGGIAYGTVPAWKLIKHGGNPMTKDQFEALADADKRALAAHVQQHINNLKGG
jgi:hypothetical protein